jgi:serine O-acetyltransferase
LAQDVARYGGWRSLWREQSLWMVAWYRLGTALSRLQPPLLRRLVLMPWWLVSRLLETWTGIGLPPETDIGGGLRIWHFGGIFVHPCTVIGRNCTLRQGVTLGNRHGQDDAPVLGDDVELGAYAQVLGAIKVGHRARIGALSVVLTDVPEGATAVGAPARVLAGKTS